MPCTAVANLACPRSDCPGTTDPAFCRHHANLSAWRTRGHEAQLAHLTQQDDRGPRIRVGLWCPSLGFGGAENWMENLVASVDGTKVEWLG